MSSFRENLVTMVEMQRVETEISSIEKELAGIDARVEALNSEVSEFEQNVADAIERLESLKKQYRSDESEIQLIESQIEKSEEKLRAVKTNKEYQSTLKEIDDLKSKASGIEDRMLEHLDQIENADHTVAEQKADLEDAKIDVATKQKAIREQEQKQQEGLERWQLERDRVLSNIDPKLQEIYEKVKQQGNGIAMAAINDAVCEVCRMNIPPQLFNELMRMDSLRMCPHCQRIMYPKTVEEELD